MIGFHKSDRGIVMKSIEERAKEFAQNYEIIPKGDDCEDCDTCTKCKDYRRYVDIVTEQKNIDDAILLKLKSAWEKQAQINHDDELNYQQGYHDAVEKSCKWLKKELRKLAMDELKDNFLENEFKFVLKSQIPKWLINFRKAMEK